LEPVAFPPEAGQRTHWNANEVGLPDHVPCVAVRVLPTMGVPVIRGSVMFVGAARVAEDTVDANATASVAPKTTARIAFAIMTLRLSLPGRSCHDLFVIRHIE
jgi:hypothetical protein